jgi:hypothetical protein
VEESSEVVSFGVPNKGFTWYQEDKSTIEVLEQLSPVEKHDLRMAEITVSNRLRSKVSLEDKLVEWRAFVSECESGYPLRIDDYTNDLSIREGVEEIIRVLPDRLANKIQTFATQLDNRFLRTTRPVSMALLKVSSPPTRLETMLYFRVPKKLKPEMKSDLQSMGILEQ